MLMFEGSKHVCIFIFPFKRETCVCFAAKFKGKEKEKNRVETMKTEKKGEKKKEEHRNFREDWLNGLDALTIAIKRNTNINI